MKDEIKITYPRGWKIKFEPALHWYGYVEETVKAPESNVEDETTVKIKCPNCLNIVEHSATWGDDIIYTCPECLCDWKAYRAAEGHIEIVERFFIG